MSKLDKNTTTNNQEIIPDSFLEKVENLISTIDTLQKKESKTFKKASVKTINAQQKAIENLQNKKAELIKSIDEELRDHNLSKQYPSLRGLLIYFKETLNALNKLDSEGVKAKITISIVNGEESSSITTSQPNSIKAVLAVLSEQSRLRLEEFIKHS
jgi:mRNA-degrading endonuclease YafQ of YafQ-DinJ toxin-antitoxin module